MSDYKRIKYLCALGLCGEIEINDMILHKDGTLICPNCGRCQWYLVPEK